MNDYLDDNYHTDMNDYPAETVNPDDTRPWTQTAIHRIPLR